MFRILSKWKRLLFKTRNIIIFIKYLYIIMVLNPLFPRKNGQTQCIFGSKQCACVGCGIPYWHGGFFSRHVWLAAYRLHFMAQFVVFWMQKMYLWLHIINRMLHVVYQNSIEREKKRTHSNRVSAETYSYIRATHVLFKTYKTRTTNSKQ